MPTITETVKTFTQEELTDRRNYIGASECAAVLGMSRWKTPLQVWAEKTDALPVEDISDQLQVKLGNRLEEVVAELFCEKTGKKVHRVEEAFTHKVYDFIRCHIDRKVEGESAILQCKTASVWKAKEWEGEEIPGEYILQEVHELACTGYDRAYIAVLIGNQEFQMKVIERSDPHIKEMIRDVVLREVDFWLNFVKTKIMPTTIKKQDTDTLYELFPKAHIGETIKLDSDAQALIDNIQAYYKDLKQLEDMIEQQKNELKAILKEAEIGETDKFIITWKEQVTRRFNIEALKVEQPDIYEKFLRPTSSRVFKFREKKIDVKEV